MTLALDNVRSALSRTPKVPQPPRRVEPRPRGWDAYHRRAELLDRLIDEVATGVRAPHLRWEESFAVAFDDLDSVLCQLRWRWHTTLAARLDAAFDNDGGDDVDVESIVDAVRRDRAALRAILDAHRDSPIVRGGDADDRRLIADAHAYAECASLARRT